jgi:hypothetical protein
MKRLALLIVAFMGVISVAACHRDTPTGPTGFTASHPPTPKTDPPRPGDETFAVSGIVTDDTGSPIAGAAVTMRYWYHGFISPLTVATDTSGRYATIEFTSTPWTSSEGRGAARAEIVVEGFDWFQRTVWATGPQLVENFRLQRIKRIAPGESVVVGVSREHGDCLGWLYNPCGRLRVASPDAGTLTLEASVVAGDGDSPALEVCCDNGNEAYGNNRVSLHVKAGSEMWVEVGQGKANLVTTQSVLVNTSFQP